LADDFLHRHRAGECPDVNEYTSKHPLLASRILELFPVILAMEQSSATTAERVGSTVGRYKLLERIGEGGFGVVYMAEQLVPVRRRVALKVIKPGCDTRQVIARFEAERQALALMEHENIARVLDAGTAESGRPYFVMELVHGVPITEYCDKNELSPRERLELFLQVCRAVQHAHTKGIIHRDIKPTNVLVTLDEGVPVPKVIDFGVAKATGQELTEKTLFTAFAQMVGTPLYMSPEQAEMSSADVDMRTDIYSLGVLLYELLTGTTPLDQERLKRSAFDEIRRIIRDEDPPRPSTRLSTLGDQAKTISARRKSDPVHLGRLIRGELDWIVMKAMEKDRRRRYETASGLARDIERYLHDEPVEACPPSALYLLSKFARRNRRALATAALVAGALLIGSIISTWQAIRATRAEHVARTMLKEAQEANANTRAVNNFLTLDVLWSAEPTVTRGHELSVRDALDNAARDVGKRFKENPRIEATVRNTLAGAYRTLGQLDKALEHSRIALDIIKRLGIEPTPDGLQIINDQGIIYMELGNGAAAEPLFRQVLEGRRRTLGNEDFNTVDAIGNLASALLIMDKLDEADPIVHEELRLRRMLHKDPLEIAFGTQRLADLCRRQGKLAEAEVAARETLALRVRGGGQDHPDTLRTKSVLASILARQGHSAEAEALLRSALADQRRVLGADHRDTIDTIDELSLLLVGRGVIEEAEPLAVEAAERSRRICGPDDPETLARINNLARVYLYRGKLADSEVLFSEALERSRRVRGEEHAQTLSISLNLGLLLMRRGRLDQAEPLLRHTLEIQQRVLGDDDIATITSVNNLGGLFFERHDFIQAEGMFRKALDAHRRVSGEAHPQTLATLSNLGRAIGAQFRDADAEPIFAELYRLTPGAQLPPRQAALFMSHWGPSLVQLERYGQAEAPLLEAMNRLRSTNQTSGEHMQRVLTALSITYDHTNRAGEANKCRAELAMLKASTQPAIRPASAPTAQN
jgi:serine/threonine protein kinase